MENITRRNLVQGAALGTVAVAAAAALAPTAAHAKADPSYAGTVDVPSFLIKPEPISDIAETKDFDVVVVGAGAAGVPAVLAALEGGATVACLQKESTAISQGNGGCGVDLGNSDPAAIEAMISFEMKENAYRPDRRQLAAWAYNSGETMRWLLNLAAEANAQSTDSAPTMEFGGGTVTFIKNSFGPKPYTTGNAMQDLAALAEQKGAEFFYETPGVQLVQDEAGRVTGVVGRAADGSHIQFNAAKGVIVATGDYQNDYDMCSYYLPDLNNFERKQFGKTGDGHKMVAWAGGKIEDGPHTDYQNDYDMCSYYLPDLNNFERKQFGKTGDGHKMVAWAGGKIEDGPHTKMLHDFDAGPASMADMPFLALKDNGERFCDEATTPMSLMCNYLRGAEDCGWYTQVFDNDYLTSTEGWPGKAVDEEAMQNYMPEVDSEKVGVLPYYTHTYKADTLEELAEKLEVTDVEAFVASVERYNELCEAGADLDFGKDPKFLAPIVNPPFWGIHRHVRISAITAGVEVNPEQQCLTPEGEVIPGLYAVGNCAGNFYGGIDYPLAIGGLSLGRCYNQGRMVGAAVAAL